MLSLYELSDADSGIVADLFAAHRRTSRPRVDDRLMFKRLYVQINDQELIDLNACSRIGSTAVRVLRHIWMQHQHELIDYATSATEPSKNA